jgi:hypothetical protein
MSIANQSQIQKRQLGNWIIDYTNTVNKISESPIAYNTWSAISVIGAVLKDNVWINRGLYKVFPNQYIVLVGPPGVGKGNAIHPAHHFVKNPPSNIPLANYIQDRVTAPKLAEILATGFPRIALSSNGSLIGAKEATCILQASELASLINSSDWMSTFLCDTWDRNEYTYDTKTKGKSTIKNMCVSLVGACVPDFVRSMNRNGNEAVNNGFTARTIFVFANDKSQSIVWPKAIDLALNSKLSNDLQMISRLHGEFCLEPVAQVIFEQKYVSITTDERDSDVIKNFKSRQPIHILKVAMALSAASSDSLVITQWDMQTAIVFVDGILATLDICFRGVGDSPLAEAIGRVLTYMERKKICSKKDMLRDNLRHVSPDDLEKVLAALLNCGYIQEVPSGRIKLYKFIGP